MARLDPTGSSYPGGVRSASKGRSHGQDLAALPLLLCSVIVGILGMHVLTQHCAMTAHESGQHSGATSAVSAMGAMVAVGAIGAVGQEHGGSVLAHGVTQVPEVLVAGAAVIGPADVGLSAGSLMACAFIVLAAATALLLARLRRLPAHPTYAVVARVVRERAGRVARADTGPPYLWEHSVIRC